MGILRGIGCPSGSLRLSMAKAWRTRAGLGDGRVQVGGCSAGCRGLGSVLLGLAQLGDGGGQRDELGHQSDGQ